MVSSSNDEGDVEMNKDEPIPYATAELFRHTMTKGAQAGSLISLTLVPLVSVFRGVKGTQLLSRVANASIVGMFGGSALLAAGTAYKLHDQSEDAIYDRAYRLRYNEGQNLVDKYSYLGGSIGFVAGAVLLNKGARGGLAGLSLGLGLGVGAYMVGRYGLKAL